MRPNPPSRSIRRPLSNPSPTCVLLPIDPTVVMEAMGREKATTFRALDGGASRAMKGEEAGGGGRVRAHTYPSRLPASFPSPSPRRINCPAVAGSNMPWVSPAANCHGKCVRLVVFFRVIL
ncbi:hypothetical protein B296_00051331 [Ensete ventricosum]|uniref:Uncharacterized protein n=1 Tax=Ensete ventricosum TaxID=4639 RepID=A0A426X2F8_ENSVE|nr:hypothetical protein B296_00051331 [Ensete ventricosum]